MQKLAARAMSGGHAGPPELALALATLLPTAPPPPTPPELVDAWPPAPVGVSLRAALGDRSSHPAAASAAKASAALQNKNRFFIEASPACAGDPQSAGDGVRRQSATATRWRAE